MEFIANMRIIGNGFYLLLKKNRFGLNISRFATEALGDFSHHYKECWRPLKGLETKDL
jgi:hypothetical protein